MRHILQYRENPEELESHENPHQNREKQKAYELGSEELN